MTGCPVKAKTCLSMLVNVLENHNEWMDISNFFVAWRQRYLEMYFWYIVSCPFENEQNSIYCLPTCKVQVLWIGHKNVIFFFSNFVAFTILKSSYVLRRQQKLWEIFTFFWLMLVPVKKRSRFRKLFVAFSEYMNVILLSSN